MNRNERKNLLPGSIVYCNGMCHNFKGLKMVVLYDPWQCIYEDLIKVSPIDERFPTMGNRIWYQSYKSLSVKPIDAMPVIDPITYNL